MAEAPEDKISAEEKMARAKELFGRGSRNYYVKAYAEAADDLSEACALFADICGPSADDCAMPYLIYGKALVALGQEENKVLDVPEEEQEEQDEDNEEQAEGEEEPDDEEEADEDSKDVDESSSEQKQEAEAVADSNGTANGAAGEIKPGSSSGEQATNGEAKENAEEGDAPNLEVAWEVLELAAIIFARQGEKSHSQLAETLTELAGISMENSHFEVAIRDFNKALDVYDQMPECNKRYVAEIHFQIGLCHSMLNSFADSVTALKKAAEVLDLEIEVQKAKEQNEDTAATIKDLEETKQEILNKIVEVDEAKQISIEEVKKELAKLMNHEPQKSADGAGSSKEPEAEKPKPTDISHLIKRKKPDSAEMGVEGSPAKKPAVEPASSSSS